MQDARSAPTRATQAVSKDTALQPGAHHEQDGDNAIAALVGDAALLLLPPPPAAANRPSNPRATRHPFVHAAAHRSLAVVCCLR